MEDIKTDGDQSGASGGEAQQQVEQLLAQLDQLKKTNERLLDEDRKRKAAINLYREQAEKSEREKLEKDGDLAKQLEFERNKRSEIEQGYAHLKQQTLKSNIYNTFLKIANDVNDIDDLLNQPKFSHILKDAIDEESLSVREDKAKEYYNEVLNAKPWLRKVNQKVGALTTKPSFVNDAPAKDFKDLSKDELEKVIRDKFRNN
jgi:hypothetical protein